MREERHSQEQGFQAGQGQETTAQGTQDDPRMRLQPGLPPSCQQLV